MSEPSVLLRLLLFLPIAGRNMTWLTFPTRLLLLATFTLLSLLLLSLLLLLLLLLLLFVLETALAAREMDERMKLSELSAVTVFAISL